MIGGGGGGGAGNKEFYKGEGVTGFRGHFSQREPWLLSLCALLVTTPNPCALRVQAWPFQSQVSPSMLSGFDNGYPFAWNIPPWPSELSTRSLRPPVPPPPGSCP